jgi:hypothetical protein
MIKQLEVPWQARALVLLDTRAERYPNEEAFEQAVRGAASSVAHLYAGGFSPELWAAERAPGLRSGNRYQQALDMLATVSMSSQLDLRSTVSRLQRAGAVTVMVGPDSQWAPAWRTAMELSWSIASAG